MDSSVGLSEETARMIEEAWNHERRHYIGVVAQLADMCFEEKLIIMYLAHRQYSYTQLHPFSVTMIESLFRPNCDLNPHEKLLWIILFGLADINYRSTINSDGLMKLTSMSKKQLKAATAGLILRYLIKKEGNLYIINKSQFISDLAKKYNLNI